MRDTEIFKLLLGLDDTWSVSFVELDTPKSELRLRVEPVEPVKCSVCGKPCPIYDHSEERTWRHLDTATIVVCRVPRTTCPVDGIKQVQVPWAGPKSRFTELFECFAILVLQLTKCQVRTAKLLRLSPNQVHDIMQRAVARGLSRQSLGEVAHVSVDEKSFQKGHDYGTIVCDVVGKRVVAVSRGRDEAAATQAFGALPRPEVVKTVSLDMSESFKNSAESCFPGADLIHDRFHIAALLAKAVDEVRRSEVKRRPELKDSRYVWLKNPENRTQRQQKLFESLLGIELKTAEAYAFKQVFKCFFESETIEEGRRFFEEWRTEVDKIELKPIKRVAKTLAKNLQGLLNYITWKLSNGYAEAVNGLIQEIKTVARGFRRFENFRIAIFFFLGRLDLHPRKS